MKKLTITIAVLVICTIYLNAQDMFKARQLTFDPAQEAFPTWSPDGKFHRMDRELYKYLEVWQNIPNGLLMDDTLFLMLTLARVLI